MRTGLIAATLAACAALGVHAMAEAQVAQGAAAPPVILGPLPPPTGAEREALIEEVRTAYPTMPERLVPMLADTRRQVGEQSPCELLEWMVSPESSAPTQTRESAARLLPTCFLPVDDVTPDAAREMLGARPLAAELRDGVLTVAARSASASVQLCCSIQSPMQRLDDSDYWVLRRRLPQAEQAMLTLTVNPGSGAAQEPVVVRGPLAPPAAPRVEGPLQGQVLERTLQSAALGETRRLSIYLPPGWSAAERWPAVFLTDGAARQFATIVEKMIADGEIPPLVLVSADPGPYGIEGLAPTLPMPLRSAEYINRYPGGAGQERFDRHMRFFAEELVRYAQAEYSVSSNREDLAVAGHSNGGVLALWAGLLHPETFGEAIPMSPGLLYIEPGDLTRTPRARFQISGGLYEPGFLRAARTAEATLDVAGFEVTARYPAAGHATDQWQFVLREALRQIYGDD